MNVDCNFNHFLYLLLKDPKAWMIKIMHDYLKWRLIFGQNK